MDVGTGVPDGPDRIKPYVCISRLIFVIVDFYCASGPVKYACAHKLRHHLLIKQAELNKATNE